MNTKKITFALLVLVTSFGFAQTASKTSSTDFREDLRFGLKAGFNYSNVYDKEGQDFVADSKFGFAGGAFVSIPLGKFIGIQPEFIYSQKGFKGSGNVLGFGYNYERTQDFLDIPILFQIKPIKEISFVVGPQFSYLLKTKNTFNNSTSTSQEDAINSENYKKNIYGFVVGADFNIEPVVISLRGGWDISKSNEDGNSSNPRYKNQLLQLTVGFAF